MTRTRIADGVRISVQVPGPMMAKMDDHLNETGLTMSEFVRRLIDQFFTERKEQ